MSCKCNWCKECSASRKLAQFEEPQEGKPRQGSNHKAYPKSRKQRLDELKQAEKDFFYWEDKEEDAKAQAFNCEWKDQGHKHGPWVCWHGLGDKWHKTHLKRYLAAMKACVDAGDVPPPSWYGKSR